MRRNSTFFLQNYVNQVMELIGDQGKFRAKSRWVNSMSVDASIAVLERIQHLPFVEKIDLVKKSSRPLLKRNQLEDSRETSYSEAFSTTFERSSASVAYGGVEAEQNMHSIPFLHELGYTGINVTVLLLDSGYYLAHEVFGQLKLKAQFDFVNNDNITTNQPGKSSLIDFSVSDWWRR